MDSSCLKFYDLDDSFLLFIHVFCLKMKASYLLYFWNLFSSLVVLKLVLGMMGTGSYAQSELLSFILKVLRLVEVLIRDSFFPFRKKRGGSLLEFKDHHL